MCTTFQVQPATNKDCAKISMVKKSPWCNNIQLLIRDFVWQSSRC